MTAFDDILKTRIEDVKDPEPLESGEWEFRCQSATAKTNEEFDPTAENSYAGTINIGCVPVQPIDFEPEDPEGWRGNTVFKRIYVRRDSDTLPVRHMTEAMGLAMEGRQIEDVLALMKDKHFVASVGLRTFKRRDGTTGKENTLSGYRPAP